MLSTKKPQIVSIERPPLAANFHEKLLVVTIDSELKFDNQITELLFKVSEKLNLLCRMLSSMSFRKTQKINESIYRITI